MPILLRSRISLPSMTSGRSISARMRSNRCKVLHRSPVLRPQRRVGYICLRAQKVRSGACCVMIRARGRRHGARNPARMMVRS